MARLKINDLQIALSHATSALELIASPVRPDGTYNRCRQACENLAKDALKSVQEALMPEPEAASNDALQPAGINAAPTSPVVTHAGKLTIYTDGGCKGNPGPAGWGAVIANADGVMLREARGFIGTAANQVAELEAAIHGLGHAPQGAVVELISDSQYVLKGLSEWRAGWLRRGWTNSAGEPVANQDHWRRLYAVADERKVSVRWVKGHSGNHFNERCDVLAAQAIATRAAHVFDNPKAAPGGASFGDEYDLVTPSSKARGSQP